MDSRVPRPPFASAGRWPDPRGACLRELAPLLGGNTPCAALPVMGCHGLRRAREWVPAGATRTVLLSMALPVRMGH